MLFDYFIRIRVCKYFIQIREIQLIKFVYCFYFISIFQLII
jgi:hypothetical protein